MNPGKLTDTLGRNIFFKKYLGVLLLLIALIVGLFTYKDYGISWDEPLQRHIVQTSNNYVLHGDTTLLSFTANEYGVAYETPLILLEKILGLKDTRDIYLLRHLVNHLFFLFSAFIFFLLIDHLYKNKLLAAIGFLLLVVNPLIYGHSFFNSKDVPFLGMLIICFMLSAIAFNKNTYKHFALLGIACGLLADIRLMGILLIGFICLFFMIDFIALRKDKKQQRKTLKLFLTFIGVTLLVIYIAWPYLWSNPIHNFIAAFMDSANPFAHYHHEHDEVMFDGQVIPAPNLPRYYIIIWFLISNPIIYLILGIWGMVFFMFRFYKNYNLFLSDQKQRNNLLYLFCFIAPLLLAFVLHSVVYDAWRQFYFIYPSFILLGIYGLNKLIKTRAKPIVLAVTMAGICLAGFYMIINYPFEHIYFNQFVRSDEPEYLRQNWELDYWGTSYKQGFEYILKKDTSANIIVKVSEAPGIYNYMILKPGDRKRIHFLDQDGYWYGQTHPVGLIIPYVDSTHSSYYFITTYRYHHNNYPYVASQVYYSIKVLNNSILTVFKLK
jgi:hypothetical protein